MDEREGPALTSVAKEVFDKLGWGRHHVRPIPWLDYLTRRQREAAHMIERYDQYNELLCTEVDACMREMLLVSMDTESRIGEEHPFTAQIAFMHTFCMIIFHLDKLWHQGSRTSRQVVNLLPVHLVVHLHHPDTNVLVSGAGESHHFGPIKMVDVHLFMANRHRFSYADPTVATRHRGKCGLAIVSMVTNNYCLKPMKIQLAQDWFGHLGPHRGRLGWCGYDSWPAWQRDDGSLYWWRYHERLNTWYMAHDVWVLLSFITMLAQANLCRSPLLFQHGQPLSIVWPLIWDVLDDVCTFTGDDWDFSFAHAIDNLVANMPDVADPSVPIDPKEPVAGHSKPLEDDEHMVGWDLDSAQFDLEED